MKIILASTSPIRKQMMEDAGISFVAVPPICDERIIKEQKSHLNMLDLALELGKAKAKSISDLNPGAYVIGSDQICEFGGKAISKSKNADDAFKSLRALEGKEHRQNNGTCIYLNGECVMEFKDIAVLGMKNLSDDDIMDYIKKDDPIGCAGSYKFELNGKYLFEKIEGTAECIQGFCVSRVKEYFLKNNII